jgi:hypothetical protein
MTTPQLTTHGDVDQEIIECWRLLLKAEEAGRHLTVDEHGEYNEAWVDAADALLAAGIVVVCAGAGVASVVTGDG